MESTQLLACPSDTASQIVDKTDKGYAGYAGNLRRSYGMAEYLGEPGGVSLASIPVVSKTFMATEYDGNFYPSPDWNMNYAAWKGEMIATKGGEWRHMDTSNFLFADGHIKAQKRPSAIGPQALIYPQDYQKDASGDSVFDDPSQFPKD